MLNLLDGICYLYQNLFAFLLNVKIYNYKYDMSGKTAHIFGSGASAINSKNSVNDGDVCLTCNLASAIRDGWDFVFIEQYRNDEFGRMQEEIISDKNIEFVILKNNYPFRSRKSFFRLLSTKNKIKNMCVLRESQASLLNLSKGNFEVSFLSLNKSEPIKQYMSSVITMILFCVKSNCKNIVLHGVDFGGKSFYEFPEYQSIKALAAKEAVLRKPNTDLLSVKEIIYFMIDELKNKNIEIKFAGEAR